MGSPHTGACRCRSPACMTGDTDSASDACVRSIRSGCGSGGAGKLLTRQAEKSLDCAALLVGASCVGQQEPERVESLLTDPFDACREFHSWIALADHFQVLRHTVV